MLSKGVILCIEHGHIETIGVAFRNEQAMAVRHARYP